MMIKTAALTIAVASVVAVAAVAAVAAAAALRAQQPGDAVLVLGEHLREPFGVTFARAIYISDSDNHRVLRVEHR